MPSKIAEYLGSKEFLDAATAAVKAAISDLEAQGIPPINEPAPSLPGLSVVIPVTKARDVDSAAD